MSAKYRIPISHLENNATAHCSDKAFKFWLSLIEYGLDYFPERGVYRFPWRVLDATMLLTTHNAVCRYPIRDPRERRRMFNELCEWGLVERRPEDGSYFIRAAIHAVPINKRIRPSDIKSPGRNAQYDEEHGGAED